MPQELLDKTKPFLLKKLKEEFEPQLKKEVENILKTKLSSETKKHRKRASYTLRYV